MANLKELRKKISVVQSTRKVTSAMKMVAGVKLRKVEQQVAASREYTDSLYAVLSRLNDRFTDINSELFLGREQVQTELLVVFVSDRGLCGNYNYMMNKAVKQFVEDFHRTGKKLRIECVGLKQFDQFKAMLNPGDSIELVDEFYRIEKLFDNAQSLARKIIDKFENGEIDKVSVLYTHYFSAIRHEIMLRSLIPLERKVNAKTSATIFEPDIDSVLRDLLPYNIGMQIYQAALESMSSEQSSRMTAMDNATRNADEMLSELSIKYNRTRQYGITQELTEVISGAQAINEE